MKVIAIISWFFVAIGCICGVLIGILGLMNSTGAPQQAVAVCFALACAIIPYCFARAWTEIRLLFK